MSPLLNVKEAAKFLKVTETTVYRLTRIGALPHLRVGRSIRFSMEILEEYIRNPNTKTAVPTTHKAVVTRL